jgi:predicted nucleic acid-binding protein
MKDVMIDTDVILDILFDRVPFSQNASEILSKCEDGEIKGFVTSVMLSNIYYLLRKTATYSKVIESLRLLMSFLHVATTDKTAVINALNSDFKDFEYALQNFSAQNDDKIKIIITRNIKDYKTSNLSVMTPDSYLKMLS